MDVVTDLTAQAASFLTVIQDLCKNQISGDKYEEYEHKFLWDLRDE